MNVPFFGSQVVVDMLFDPRTAESARRMLRAAMQIGKALRELNEFERGVVFEGAQCMRMVRPEQLDAMVDQAFAAADPFSTMRVLESLSLPLRVGELPDGWPREFAPSAETAALLEQVVTELEKARPASPLPTVVPPGLRN